MNQKISLVEKTNQERLSIELILESFDKLDNQYNKKLILRPNNNRK